MFISALDALRRSGITVASDGAEYNKIAEFDPVDATTNPSLVLAAVSKPEYSYLVDEAIQYTQQSRPFASLEERTDLAVDRLLVQVGIRILDLIPGRVSVSVDPRLGYDYEAMVNKGRTLVALFEEFDIPQERVLIKIPATYPGILAAQTLESPSDSSAPIHTNLTLIFGLVQALACAQAGISVISPFVGRVKDWWAVRAIKDGQPEGLSSQPLSEHPGILLVQQIRTAYTAYGYKTQVMAAGFRKVEEIVELSKAGSRGGPDLVTLPPDLLDGLRNRDGAETTPEEVKLKSEALLEPRYFSPHPTAAGEALFTRDSEIEAITLDKVPEGLAKFSADAQILADKVKALMSGITEVSTSPSRRGNIPVEKAVGERKHLIKVQ